MPLYDLRCTECEGIFEMMRPIAERGHDTVCPYCKQDVAVEPMMTGGRVRVKLAHRWQPSSKVEELTGQRAGGPGTNPNASRTSVLHTCRGFNCSICKT